ncbi:cell division FtsZ family protein [bacterium]|nr:cell division FtsZ family protein [bacterium]
MGIQAEKRDVVRQAEIGVIGVGGCGGNAVGMMSKKRKEDGDESVLRTTRIIAANTDLQALDDDEIKLCDSIIQLGPNLTHGQGSGGRPDTGKGAAEESLVSIAEKIKGLDMLFITAGMGGGTGTGASPIIAKNAKENGCLTVAVVTTPSKYEGKRKMRLANEGIENLKKYVDSLIIISNDTLFDYAGDEESSDMFKRSNEVLIDSVENITTLIAKRGVMNIDFADVKNIMSGIGLTLIVSGHAEGSARQAVEDALNSQLLEGYTIKGSSRAIIYFSGNIPGRDLKDACEYFLQEIGNDDLEYKQGLCPTSDSMITVFIIAAATRVDNELKSFLPEVNEKVQSDITSFADVPPIPMIGPEVKHLSQPIANIQATSVPISKNSRKVSIEEIDIFDIVESTAEKVEIKK